MTSYLLQGFLNTEITNISLIDTQIFFVSTSLFVKELFSLYTYYTCFYLSRYIATVELDEFTFVTYDFNNINEQTNKKFVKNTYFFYIFFDFSFSLFQRYSFFPSMHIMTMSKCLLPIIEYKIS